jgi:ferric-dicitrate binding protein FerR (iron transport regulator)
MKNIIILFTLLLSPLTLAKGRVLFFKGDVFHNGKKMTSKIEVKKNDTITTGARSLAVLKLDDGSNIKINEKSSLSIGKASSTQSLINVQKGSAFFRVLKKNFINQKAKKKKHKFVVKYKTVAMGVRGTEFFVSDGKENSSDIWMCVNEGKVVVKSNSEKESTLVKAGEGIVVKNGKKTSSPKPLKWTRNLNWKMDNQKGDLTNKVSIEEAYTDLLEHDYD